MLLRLFKSGGHRSLSAADIFKECENEDISLSAIYRNLKTMEDEGLICKVAGNRKSEAYYHYVNPHSCVGVVHLKCECCENVFHLNTHVSNFIFNFVQDEMGFTINNKSAFLLGKCGNCSQI